MGIKYSVHIRNLIPKKGQTEALQNKPLKNGNLGPYKRGRIRSK